MHFFRSLVAFGAAATELCNAIESITLVSSHHKRVPRRYKYLYVQENHYELLINEVARESNTCLTV